MTQQKVWALTCSLFIYACSIWLSYEVAEWWGVGLYVLGGFTYAIRLKILQMGGWKLP